MLPEQLTPASPSPQPSPEGENGTTQILKDGISLSGGTAAVISTGKRQKKSVWNWFHVKQLHFIKNVLQTYYCKSLSSCLIFKNTCRSHSYSSELVFWCPCYSNKCWGTRISDRSARPGSLFLCEEGNCTVLSCLSHSLMYEMGIDVAMWPKAHMIFWSHASCTVM